MYSRSKPEGAWAQRWHQHWVGAGTIKFTQPSRHRGLQMCVWMCACVCARALLSNRKWDAETRETLKATSWFLINTSSESFTFACNTEKKNKNLRRSRLFHEVWRAWKLKLFRVVSSSFSSSSYSPMVSIIIFFCLPHSLITFWGGKGSFGILEIKPS